METTYRNRKVSSGAELGESHEKSREEGEYRASVVRVGNVEH